MLVDRAYSKLEIKALDEDQRIITGMATTPDVDRVGDVIDPMGAKFAPSMPLLWSHKHDSPVGIAEFGTPTKKGIPFKAVIAKISEDGLLKQLTDLAWHSVKAGLIRAVSVGFRPLKYDIMDKGGIHYKETEVFELSLVSVPANAFATIQTIKALDVPMMESGAVRLIERAAEKPHDMKGAVRLISAHSLASLPLKANR